MAQTQDPQPFLSAVEEKELSSSLVDVARKQISYRFGRICGANDWSEKDLWWMVYEIYEGAITALPP